jgi:hypothetical protein
MGIAYPGGPLSDCDGLPSPSFHPFPLAFSCLNHQRELVCFDKQHDLRNRPFLVPSAVTMVPTVAHGPFFSGASLRPRPIALRPCARP